MHIQKGKRFLEILVKLLFYAFILYLLFGIYIANLGYDTERNHIIHAELYQDGEKQEDVTIEVTGTFHHFSRIPMKVALLSPVCRKHSLKLLSPTSDGQKEMQQAALFHPRPSFSMIQKKELI